MNDTHENSKAIVHIGSKDIVRASISIDITKKLLYGRIETLFNEAYRLLYDELSTVNINIHFDIVNNPSFLEKLDVFFDNRSYATDEINYHQAINHLSEIINLNPFFEYSYYFRGIAYENIGKWDLALEDYSTLIKLSNKTTLGYRKRAYFYFIHIGDAKKALEDCAEGLKINEQDEQCLEIMILINECILNDLEKEFELVNKLLEINPNHLDCLRRRAFYYYKRKEFSNAISNVDIAIKLNPNNVGLYSLKGRICAAKFDYQIAIQNFTYAINNWNKGIEKSYVISNVYMEISDIYSKIGNKAEALKNQILSQKWKGYLPF